MNIDPSPAPSPPPPQPAATVEWPQVLSAQPRAYAPGDLVGADASDESLIRIVSGWAYEGRATADRRQVFAFLLPGDDGLAPSRPCVETGAVVALTRLDVLEATVTSGDLSRPSRADLIAPVLERDLSRLREQAVRLGLMSAQARIADLFLDLHRRLSAVGHVRRDSFHTPLTQDLIASALGLSVVHVNRSLQRMRHGQLLTVQSGRVTVHDLRAMIEMAGRTPP